VVSISSFFPRRYIAADDLKNLPAVLKISYVQEEDVGQDRKPVLYFMGIQKGLVLNKTNARALAVAFGDETDSWSERPVTLREVVVDYRGTPTRTTRVFPGAAKSPKSPPAPQDPSDDIPF
jgi:hypothetical protein